MFILLNTLKGTQMYLKVPLSVSIFTCKARNPVSSVYLCLFSEPLRHAYDELHTALDEHTRSVSIHTHTEDVIHRLVPVNAARRLTQIRHYLLAALYVHYSIRMRLR